MGMACNTHGGEEDFGGKPEGKRLLRRPKRRWEATIKMDLGETEWGGID
jgi:hypothetical protein